MKCDLNLEEYKDNYTEFSLKVTEITDSSNNPIYLSRINEAILIYEEEKEEEEEKIKEDEKIKEHDKMDGNEKIEEKKKIMLV